MNWLIHKKTSKRLLNNVSRAILSFVVPLSPFLSTACQEVKISNSRTGNFGALSLSQTNISLAVGESVKLSANPSNKTLQSSLASSLTFSWDGCSDGTIAKESDDAS